ncbi:hypothetical protein DSL72_004860 [Monilinia vaccinii-corymbosi]|uniref:Uncharacterized protein n=1 Tax=Monilinia vaccinii-corymbosi TaxID=61207 RepID=A0A8A3P804_9HELO|nr:hypothetical protein DSL72_004860 [Monilinia vaccinii-corymbosi]
MVNVAVANVLRDTNKLEEAWSRGFAENRLESTTIKSIGSYGVMAKEVGKAETTKFDGQPASRL